LSILTDNSVLPPGLTASDFEAARRAFAAVLGDSAVLPTYEQLREFRDPYIYAEWDDHWPSAVVQSANVEEVQGAVAIATLRRMNRMLEINDELRLRGGGAGGHVLRPPRGAPQAWQRAVDIDYRPGLGSVVGNAVSKTRWTPTGSCRPGNSESGRAHRPGKNAKRHG